MSDDNKSETCKLVFSDASFQALKPLVAACVSGRSVQCCQPTDEPAAWQLSLCGAPVLVTASGEALFSASAAARYLLAPVTAEVDVWLGWDSLVLAPAVQSLHSAPANPPPTAFTSALDKLSAVGPLPSPADYIVWSTLYPLLQSHSAGGSRSAALLAQYPPLFDWLHTLTSSAICQRAVKLITTNTASPPQQQQQQSATSASRQAAVTVRRERDSPRPSPQPPVASTESGQEREEEDPVSVYLAGVSEQQLAALVRSAAPLRPDAARRSVLVTSALPYVNNVPHLGNIVGSVLSADVFARYRRLTNSCVLYVCGTDEYGTATETRALQERCTPQQLCDKYHALHAQVYSWFDIDFDHFGRTTNCHQTGIAQQIFGDMHANGFTSQQTVDQLYCGQCERFLADRFVEGECPMCGFFDARGDQCDGCGRLINAVELRRPRCKLCAAAPAVRSSRHVFFELGRQQRALRDWMKPQTAGATESDGGAAQWSDNARVIAETWLRDGLKARCITRDLRWGTPVPLPGYEQKVFYVWFDAPIGYISITASYTPHWQEWWMTAASSSAPSCASQPEYVQFMAKDNVPFHAIVFPACLMATGRPYRLVTSIQATEYLNYESGKFSKSRGVGVFGTDAIESGIGSDLWRFYLISVRPDGHDASFSWDEMALRCNSELLNNLGNFVNRALAFCARAYGGIVPPFNRAEPGDADTLRQVSSEVADYRRLMERACLRDALRCVLAVSRLGNQYMQLNAPWSLAKGDASQRERCGSVVSLAVNLCALLALLLEPFMPHTARHIRRQLAMRHSELGYSGTRSVEAAPLAVTDRCVQLLAPGHAIGTPQPLFAKLEPQLITRLKQQFAGCAAGAAPAKPAPAEAAAGKPAPAEAAAGKPAPAEAAAGKPAPAEAAAAKPAPAEAAAGKPTSAEAAEVSEPGLEKACASAAALESSVAAQASVVRELKAAAAPDKAAVDAAVAQLLQLKEKLRLAHGLPPQTKTKKKKNKKK